MSDDELVQLNNELEDRISDLETERDQLADELDTIRAERDRLKDWNDDVRSKVSDFARDIGLTYI